MFYFRSTQHQYYIKRNSIRRKLMVVLSSRQDTGRVKFFVNTSKFNVDICSGIYSDNSFCQTLQSAFYLCHLHSKILALSNHRCTIRNKKVILYTFWTKSGKFGHSTCTKYYAPAPTYCLLWLISNKQIVPCNGFLHKYCPTS